MSFPDWTFVKEFVQTISWVVASVGGVIAAFKAITELRETRLQRARDLRWKQAELAKEMLDDLFGNDRANNALLMLDWSGRRFPISSEEERSITSEQMLEALRVVDLGFNKVEIYVRDCFDHLFFHVDRLERSIRSGLILFEDVSFPLDYFAGKISQHKEVFATFIRDYGYLMSYEFFDRFESWRLGVKSIDQIATTPTAVS